MSAVTATVPAGGVPGTLIASTWSGVRYGALGFALAFLALPLYVILPSHYATQYRVALATLGAVLLATRALDAVLDPFIGRAVDRVLEHSVRWAWTCAALAALVVGTGFTALFFPQVGEAWTVVWLTASLLPTYLGFSVLSVIHQAWGTRLGGDREHRARVVAWREGFGLAGVLAASVLPSLFGLGAASTLLALALAVGVVLLAGAPSVSSVRIQPDRVQTAPWALPWHAAPFRRLLAVFMLNGIASAVPATLVLFFVRDRLQAQHAEALFLGAYFAAAAVSIPLWLRGVRAFGLARAWLVGMGLAIAAFVWALMLGTGEIAGFLAVCIASGVALGADLTIPGAMLTGVVQRAGHHASAEGVYVGWWTAATKLNLGLAAGGTLPLLSLAGYAPGRSDEQALFVLGLAYVAVPCALKLTAAAMLWRWWIDKEAEE